MIECLLLGQKALGTEEKCDIMEILQEKSSAAVSLSGVPETMLFPLWNRAGEQVRAEPLIDDPISARLVKQIDYDFKASFGKPNVGHAIRSRVIDDAIKAWLAVYPQGTVIALGEGLESQFWRVDNGTMQWLSVDLPESIEVRRRFLPDEERMTMFACSALDEQWMASAPPSEPVFITAAGLLMYFEESEVIHLLRLLAERFPGSELIFDVIPEWMSKKSLKGLKLSKTYQLPPMPWGLSYIEKDKILQSHPRYEIKRQTTYVDAFPQRMRPYNHLVKIAFLRKLLTPLSPWLIHLEITGQ